MKCTDLSVEVTFELNDTIGYTDEGLVDEAKAVLKANNIPDMPFSGFTTHHLKTVVFSPFKIEDPA